MKNELGKFDGRKGEVHERDNRFIFDLTRNALNI